MKSLLTRFRNGLQRTKTSLVRNIQSMFQVTGAWSDEQYDDLEAALIAADLGVAISTRLVDQIRDRYERGEIDTAEDIIRVARTEIAGIVSDDRNHALNQPAEGPMVILMVGVNGSGKTTTTGKLAALWKQDGKSVMLSACDTFRAAAIEQLMIWGERVDCPVIAGRHGADAASVAFDAVNAAKARNIDLLLVDTAGRQHTRVGLMEELAKINRILGKALPGAPHETWLVVDGSTGLNGLSQAREFGRAAPLTGLCLTKLDGTSKGGVVVAIHEEFHLPIRFVGFGESVEDLQPFNPDYFAQAMFDDPSRT